MKEDLVRRTQETAEMVQKLHEVAHTRPNGSVIYEMGVAGESPSTGNNLLRVGGLIAVQAAVLPAGTLARHEHDGAEALHVYRGRALVHFDEGAPIEVGEYASIFIAPRRPHSIEVLEEVWCVGVTMPADEGYPR